MKTNVVMNRTMGKFQVHQRTKDGMFNATSLLKQWNKDQGSKKELPSFFKMKSTQEFIETLNEDENLNMANSPYLKTRGKKGGTWMHPYLFIDFAMWLNPKFKLEVIKFVSDQLIETRHQAGDNYKILSAAGKKLHGYVYQDVAKALQWIVFNKTDKETRQNATTAQLQELSEIQNKLAFAIDMGYINSYSALISEMKRIYRKKYPKLKISA